MSAKASNQEEELANELESASFPLAQTELASSVNLPVASVHNTDPSPALLADMMLAALLRPGGGLVTLDPDGPNATILLRQGNATLAQLTATIDVAAAAIGRLARMAKLDPLAERSSVTEPRAARFAVKLGDEVAEVLVTLGATGMGMSAELRLLSLGGRPIERRPMAQLKRCSTCGTYQPPMRTRCDLDGGPLREVWDDPSPDGTIGTYIVRSVLGEGAMGEVFAAEHALIDRKVAIKVLHADMASDPAFESRFLLEARATSRLRHANIVEVTDYGVLATGSPYIVMERLEGESFERRLAHGKTMTPVTALRFAREVAIGLGAAHEGGVIHNDLKPSNVFVLRDSTDEEPRLKVIDFGAASFAGLRDDGLVVGTAAFMAPERIAGEGSDPRSDVYSLGVMIHRMISGALPFEAKDAAEMFAAHKQRPPTPLSSPTGPLPVRVGRLVARALEKKPSERYQTMEQMIADIDHAIGSFQVTGWRRWMP